MEITVLGRHFRALVAEVRFLNSPRARHTPEDREVKIWIGKHWGRLGFFFRLTVCFVCLTPDNFNIAQFVDNPTLSQLNKCKKGGLCEITDYYVCLQFPCKSETESRAARWRNE